MKLDEYEKVKDLRYRDYCDYLQRKYGIGLSDYMTRNWNKSKKIARTKDGLYAHHKYEDHAIKLADREYAQRNPYEWQLAENIVYCDYLEHLFLHILICENPAPDKNVNEDVGIGGIVEYMIPELNDLYSGWQTAQSWRKNCHDLVKNDKEVYMLLLKRFKAYLQTRVDTLLYDIEDCLLHSCNAPFSWSEANNADLYNEIKAL